ncbi:serine/threonine-protein kinase [Providencia alcalifaciens]|uniref:serine/threonine-protein kinase n=1 Tax=Providencia TaxID=586 RepID=UPI000BD6148E|nr:MULTISPECIES: serine/threonine-protein kinase [Providencia]MBV2187676.1 serine/threonine protein kinase [Providencia rettgeri]PCQ37980.1 protein kinase [Providencia rettgeri]HEM8137460.1 serine/threonine protein kinase [Providencia rettgeri]
MIDARISFKEIRELDEQGKNSRVFLAYDKNLDSNLVIKEIKKDKFDCDEYFNEARKLYQSSHPNVVQIQYAAQNDNFIYLGLPFYERGSIKGLMNRNNLTCHEVIRYSIQFLSGLYHIHTKGLIHFDIKPDNILLSERNEALLSDFGLAEKIDNDGFATPTKIYTKFQAPEAFGTYDLDFTFDIYQAGVTMYVMAVGLSQFEKEVQQIISTGNPIDEIINGRFPLKNYPPHIPLSIKKIINKCLEKNTKDRYQSVQLILNDLSKINNSDSLHWRMFSEKEKTIWINDASNANLKLEFDIVNGSCYGTKLLSNGNRQRISSYCMDAVKESDLRSILTK